MCGRFTQYYTWPEVHKAMDLIPTMRNLRPRYNIAPTTSVDVVRPTEQGREIVPMRWGLAPFFWKKPLRELPATFNARAETVAEKPMFRDAFRRRRCIVPASGFYEWTGDKKDRQPYYFTAADGAPVLALAGLWDRCIDVETQEPVRSCTFIVTEPSEWMSAYHDRMPVILEAAQIQPWLDGALGPEALKPPAQEALCCWPVSKRMNRTGAGDDDSGTVAVVGVGA
jgi:putative SOS response-associated peptidase YedK